MSDVAAWTLRVTELEETWGSLAGPAVKGSPIGDWARVYDKLVADEGRIRADGRWVSGYSDLMHLARIADDELKHSNILAWLLDPAGRHGFGDRLLGTLLSMGWPDLPVPETRGAIIEREVRRGFRIADVVVSLGQTTLVVENKVWAPESRRQCQDLYELWLDAGPDVRYLLLTRDGHPPRETRSPAAADAWRSLSYPCLAGWLTEHLPSPPRSMAQKSVEQYVATILETWRSTEPFRIGIGGGAVGD